MNVDAAVGTWKMLDVLQHHATSHQHGALCWRPCPSKPAPWRWPLSGPSPPGCDEEDTDCPKRPESQGRKDGLEPCKWKNEGKDKQNTHRDGDEMIHKLEHEWKMKMNNADGEERWEEKAKKKKSYMQIHLKLRASRARGLQTYRQVDRCVHIFRDIMEISGGKQLFCSLE